MLELFRSQIEKDLKAQSALLDELAGIYMNSGHNLSSADELLKYLSSMQITQSLWQKIANARADCFFLSSSEYDVDLIRFRAGFQEVFQVESYIKSRPDFANSAGSQTWEVHYINAIPYLFKVYLLKDAKIGTGISLERLRGLPSGDSLFFDGFEIAPNEHNAFERSAIQNTPLVLTAAFENGSSFLSGPLIAMAGLGILALMAVGASVLLMIRQIHEWTYTKELDKQKDELRYLRSQIKPHFYI
jgi:uncharacterized membrane-anchored protein YhcB (DUF1043 family)